MKSQMILINLQEILDDFVENVSEIDDATLKGLLLSLERAYIHTMVEAQLRLFNVTPFSNVSER